MTLVTIGVLQLVVTVHVTRLTRDGLVSSCQREVCGSMIKRAPIPACCRVTLRAVVTEIARNVVRVRCLLEIRLVALVTLCVRELIVSVDVARLACSGRMRTCQREVGRCMIERRWSPDGRRMALGAFVTEVRRHMVWTRRQLEIRRMALIAIGVLELIIVINVARLTGCRRVRPT